MTKGVRVLAKGGNVGAGVSENFVDLRVTFSPNFTHREVIAHLEVAARKFMQTRNHPFEGPEVFDDDEPEDKVSWRGTGATVIDAGEITADKLVNGPLWLATQGHAIKDVSIWDPDKRVVGDINIETLDDGSTKLSMVTEITPEGPKVAQLVPEEPKPRYPFIQKLIDAKRKLFKDGGVYDKKDEDRDA
jgi:hypothetical protein